MYKPETEDQHAIVMLRTKTLVAWLRRPHHGHTKWWIAYYSTDADEALAWDMAIKHPKAKEQLAPFHQVTWPIDHHIHHPKCPKLPHVAYACPGVVQGWEMWLGCSDWALETPQSPLEEILEYGDGALWTVLLGFKVAAFNANRLLKNWQVRSENAPELFRHPLVSPASAQVA